MTTFDPYATERQHLIGRLSAMEVRGIIAEKLFRPETRYTPPAHIIQIKFKDRIIEKTVTESEFSRAKAGDAISFSPPVPECPACACYSGVCLSLGLAVGIAAIWAISKYASGTTATLLFFIALTIILLGIFISLCVHEHKVHMEVLANALTFFQPSTSEQQNGE